MITKKHWGELEDKEDIIDNVNNGKKANMNSNLHYFELPPLYQPQCPQKTIKKE